MVVEAAVEVANASHQFSVSGRQLLVLAGVNLTIQRQHFVSLLGPSGCGKTTLLRIVDGLIRPTSGHVQVDGVRVVGPSTDRAMVFQEFGLMPWRTTLQNAEFGLELQGVPRHERRQRAMAALELVQLGDFLEHYPHQLSGGMKQRVGLARALATNPRLLLMDEPFGSLDPQTRELMQIELLRIWESDRKTVVFVTHSIEEALFLSDQIVLMSPRPGRVREVLDVDLPRPRWEAEEEIKASPRFTELRRYLWAQLKAELRD